MAPQDPVSLTAVKKMHTNDDTENSTLAGCGSVDHPSTPLSVAGSSSASSSSSSPSPPTKRRLTSRDIEEGETMETEEEEEGSEECRRSPVKASAAQRNGRSLRNGQRPTTKSHSDSSEVGSDDANLDVASAALPNAPKTAGRSSVLSPFAEPFEPSGCFYSPPPSAHQQCWTVTPPEYFNSTVYLGDDGLYYCFVPPDVYTYDYVDDVEEAGEDYGPFADVDSPVVEEMRTVAEDDHPLETGWRFMYDKKVRGQQETADYARNIRSLGSFNSVEGFYRLFSRLKKASQLPADYNLALFRDGCKPMWEDYPNGGMWIVRVKKRIANGTSQHIEKEKDKDADGMAGGRSIDVLWENLVLACIGENFESREVVGAVLSIRLREDVLSIWMSSSQNAKLRNEVRERVREIFQLPCHSVVQFKEFRQAMKDFSSYRNAKNFVIKDAAAKSENGDLASEAPSTTTWQRIDRGANRKRCSSSYDGWSRRHRDRHPSQCQPAWKSRSRFNSHWTHHGGESRSRVETEERIQIEYRIEVPKVAKGCQCSPEEDEGVRSPAGLNEERARCMCEPKRNTTRRMTDDGVGVGGSRWVERRNDNKTSNSPTERRTGRHGATTSGEDSPQAQRKTKKGGGKEEDDHNASDFCDQPPSTSNETVEEILVQ